MRVESGTTKFELPLQHDDQSLLLITLRGLVAGAQVIMALLGTQKVFKMYSDTEMHSRRIRLSIAVDARYIKCAPFLRSR